MSLEPQYIENPYCVTNSDNHWWIWKSTFENFAGAMTANGGGLSDLEFVKIDGAATAVVCGLWGEWGEVLGFCEDVAGCVHVNPVVH